MVVVSFCSVAGAGVCAGIGAGAGVVAVVVVVMVVVDAVSFSFKPSDNSLSNLIRLSLKDLKLGLILAALTVVVFGDLEIDAIAFNVLVELLFESSKRLFLAGAP